MITIIFDIWSHLSYLWSTLVRFIIIIIYKVNVTFSTTENTSTANGLSNWMHTFVKITLFTIASLTSVRINTMLVRVNGLESHIRKTQADKQTKMHEQTHAQTCWKMIENGTEVVGNTKWWRQQIMLILINKVLVNTKMKT